MNRTGMAWTLALLLAGILAPLGGCNKELKAENEELHKQNVELEDELSRSRAALEAASADLARLQQQLADAGSGQPGSGNGLEGLEGGGVNVTQGDGEVTVSVAGDVLFDSGSATLKSSIKAKLKQIAAALKDGSQSSIRIEGHTDSDPIKKSKWRDNYDLSEARAAAVRDYLAGQGVSRSSMTIDGLGDTSPVSDNSTKSGKAQNRRVEIVVVTG